MPAAPTPAVHDAIVALQRLTDLFRARRAALAAGAGLTEQQWEVLERIASERFMPSMFARDRASSAAAVSRLTRQLQDKRLVTASARAHDGRQREYVLTAKGRRALAALRAEREAAIASIWAPLDAAALAAFTRTSRELADRIAAYDGAGA